MNLLHNQNVSLLSRDNKFLGIKALLRPNDVAGY